MTKLNFLTTTEHAFFYRESNAFAKQAAISWLTVNGFENEIAELREKEDSLDAWEDDWTEEAW